MTYADAIKCLANAELFDDLLLLLTYRGENGTRQGWDKSRTLAALSDEAAQLLKQHGSLARALA